MKFCVKNELELFEFHDAEFSFVDLNKNRLVLASKHLNIHKNVTQNPYDYDMEIDYAKFVFSGFEVISLELMRAYKVDDDGNWYTNEPQIIYNGKEAEKHFLNEIKNGITINCIDICKKENKTYIELSTCAQAYFLVTFAFDEVFVEWDEYRKKAWYELHKQYIHQGYLITPAGEEETEIHIVYHEEDTCFQGELDKGPTVSIGVKYNDEQLWGQGKDYLWVDAFANVQKQLPVGVFLKCCMTCQHGNMCPFGSEPGKIYCTKDFIINSKEDMCNLFNYDERFRTAEMIKNVAHSCDEYRHQSNDYYTYNDYLYYLNNFEKELK